MNFLKAKSYKLQATSGLTLVEMMVTVGIFILISTIVLVRNSQFDNETLLQGLAYDIALSVREAQQFGINVRIAADQFQEPYGVHFQSETNTYVLFRDFDDDGVYDALSGEELKTYTIGRGASIGDLCDAATGTCVKTFDIIFRRPDPDAIINGGTISRATIELLSANQQGVRLIVVESTGQISVTRVPDEEL